ncbi:MAG: adenylate/guanylate cyclase domain-containing protein [Cyclobacteriaceae bacterium]|nr:adenylate/guanylate cyclase domain-containing protein [Cyclobacteriaceae bacterium]
MSQQTRQLAAIMFTDIEGYTALMQKDEQQAVQLRARHREIFNATTTKYQGQILQYYGDGTLSIFSSVIDSVNCAAEMQVLFQQEPVVPVRIGIHLGDIIVREDEVIGDAVNIASRIESLAVVGSVLVSNRVQMDLKNHQEIRTQSLGYFEFKNVQQPMEVFALDHKGLKIPVAKEMLNKGKVSRRDVPNNLPKPATRFFGRKKELEQLAELLENHRLVTLVGPGGCGKTRLSMEVAGETMPFFPDGVWFVGLAQVTNPELVADTLAETLHIKPEKGKPIEETVARKLSNKKLLIVFDNCEHVIDECARILGLLMVNTVDPRILTTSRETLNIPGEATYRISPLPVPESNAKPDEILVFDAVQLFRDRVLLNKPDFELDESNSQVVSTICQKLEGIPLAIEMAASRIKVMDPNTILDRLSDQFRLLSGGLRTAPQHQRTLRATIDWSNDLLTKDEKTLFYRLSIFTSDFDLEDAEKVCGYHPLTELQILDLLAQIVDKSLIVTLERDRIIRYRLLEVMKQYGQEKVSQNGEMEELQQHYANYYLEQAGLAHEERMKDGIRWSAWLSQELPNIQGALNIFQSEPAQRLKLASLLAEFFFLHANLSIGQKILSSALEASSDRNVDRARALCGLGFIEILIDPDLGYQKMTEGIQIIQELEDEQAKLDIYWRYGSFKSAYGDWEEAQMIMEEGLQIARDRKDPWMELRYKNNLSWVAIGQLKPELVEADIDSNLKEALELGNIYDITDAYHINADVAFLKGDFKLAESRYAEAINNALKMGSDLEVNVLLNSLAISVAGQGRYEKGLRLFGASLEKFEELEAVIPELDTVMKRYNLTIQKAIDALGEAKSQSLHAEGRKMGFEQAIDYAFDMGKD